MTIYTSSLPSTPVDSESLYTHLFRSKYFSTPSDATVLVDAYTGNSVTFGEMFVVTRRLAWGLRNEFHRLGGVTLKRGDVVMLLSPNTVAWPIVQYGCIAAGLPVTPANPTYTAHELVFQYKDSGAKAVVIHPKLAPLALQMFKLHNMGEAEARRHIIVADWLEMSDVPTQFVRMTQLMNKGIMEREEPFDGELANKTTLLCYSSGTTGNPKGVETTHKNLNTMLHVVRVVFPEISSENKDAVLGFLPFFHIFGGVSLLNTALVKGIPLVIMSHFDMEDFCKFVEKYKVTVSMIVPPVCLALLHHPAVNKYNIKSLRYLLSAAAPLGKQLVLAVRDKLRSVGVDDVYLFQGYGLTETSPSVSAIPPANFLEKAGSVGVLNPIWELRIVSDDDRDVEAGEPGEIWLRGPAVMKGYLNNKEATANAITKDGWLKTGDIGYMDPDQYLFIVDRKKELIKYKGFQVAPAELEATLLTHPDIVDAAVIGVKGEETELPRAYVVRRTGMPKTPEEGKAWISGIHEWISTRLARHKHLRGGIVIIEAVPKSAAGKILRKELNVLAQKEMSRDIGAKL